MIKYAARRNDPQFWETALNYVDSSDLTNQLILESGKRATTISLDFWERYLKALEVLDRLDESEFWQFVVKKKNESLWQVYLQRPYITEMKVKSRFELLRDTFPKTTELVPSDDMTKHWRGFSRTLDYSNTSFDEALEDVRSIPHWSVQKAIFNTGNWSLEQKINIALTSNFLLAWGYLADTIDDLDEAVKLHEEFIKRYNTPDREKSLYTAYTHVLNKVHRKIKELAPAAGGN